MKPKLDASLTTLRVATLDDGARQWLRARLRRSLLILADTTPPLLRRSQFWTCKDQQRDEYAGVGVRFEGFDTPILSIVADTDHAAAVLLETIRRSGEPEILAVGTAQPLPEGCGAPNTTDLWLTAPCRPTDAQPERGAELLFEPSALEAFYHTHGVRFWSPDLLHYGPASVVKMPSAGIVSAISVNFVLPEFGYAHLGALFTDARYRERACADAVMDRSRRWLADHSVIECGLFAEADDERLLRFYRRRGFTRRGAFSLLSLAPN